MALRRRTSAYALVGSAATCPPRAHAGRRARSLGSPARSSVDARSTARCTVRNLVALTPPYCAASATVLVNGACPCSGPLLRGQSLTILLQCLGSHGACLYRTAVVPPRHAPAPLRARAMDRGARADAHPQLRRAGCWRYAPCARRRDWDPDASTCHNRPGIPRTPPTPPTFLGPHTNERLRREWRRDPRLGNVGGRRAVHHDPRPRNEDDPPSDVLHLPPGPGDAPPAALR